MAKKETSPELTEEFKKTLAMTKMLDIEVDEELKRSFLRAPYRRAPTVGARGKRLVDLPTVVAHDILYVVIVLESSLNLKRHNTRIDEVTDTLREVEVLDREEVFSSNEFLSTTRNQIVGEAAWLRALAPISRAR